MSRHLYLSLTLICSSLGITQSPLIAANGESQQTSNTLGGYLKKIDNDRVAYAQLRDAVIDNDRKAMTVIFQQQGIPYPSAQKMAALRKYFLLRNAMEKMQKFQGNEDDLLKSLQQKDLAKIRAAASDGGVDLSLEEVKALLQFFVYMPALQSLGEDKMMQMLNSPDYLSRARQFESENRLFPRLTDDEITLAREAFVGKTTAKEPAGATPKPQPTTLYKPDTVVEYNAWADKLWGSALLSGNQETINRVAYLFSLEPYLDHIPDETKKFESYRGRSTLTPEEKQELADFLNTYQYASKKQFSLMNFPGMQEEWVKRLREGTVWKVRDLVIVHRYNHSDEEIEKEIKKQNDFDTIDGLEERWNEHLLNEDFLKLRALENNYGWHPLTDDEKKFAMQQAKRRR